MHRTFGAETSKTPEAIFRWPKPSEGEPKVTNFLGYPQFKQDIPTPDCAMGVVDWYDAARYCNWLSRTEGTPEDQWCYPEKIGPGTTLSMDLLERTGYRLPTEAEWEYACRAGSAAARPYGGSEELLPEYGWYLSNARRRMHPVGGKKPNDLGLFDVLGNAWEWTLDPFDFYRPGLRLLWWGYTTSAYALKQAEFSDRVVRVRRDGSFNVPAPLLRSAYRAGLRPLLRDAKLLPSPREDLPLIPLPFYSLRAPVSAMSADPPKPKRPASGWLLKKL